MRSSPPFAYIIRTIINSGIDLILTTSIGLFILWEHLWQQKGALGDLRTTQPSWPLQVLKHTLAFQGTSDDWPSPSTLIQHLTLCWPAWSPQHVQKFICSIKRPLIMWTNTWKGILLTITSLSCSIVNSFFSVTLRAGVFFCRECKERFN